jgi:hypothetical protein
MVLMSGDRNFDVLLDLLKTSGSDLRENKVSIAIDDRRIETRRGERTIAINSYNILSNGDLRADSTDCGDGGFFPQLLRRPNGRSGPRRR